MPASQGGIDGGCSGFRLVLLQQLVGAAAALAATGGDRIQVTQFAGALAGSVTDVLFGSGEASTGRRTWKKKTGNTDVAHYC
nr:hypothetical protein [Laribacter hongkongensis]